MRRCHWLAVLIGFVSVVITDAAQAFEGMSFNHKDWLLVCDNTGTCRAVGYAQEDSEHPVAVMLTRAAGPDTRVTGKIYLGMTFGDDPSPTSFSLYINGKNFGALSNTPNSVLTDKQVNALLAVMAHKARITVGDAQRQWSISAAGSSAVFRKMDEFQGRLQTPSAIIVKGHRDEMTVPPAALPPQIINYGGRGKLTQVAEGSLRYKQLLQILQRNDDANGDNDDSGCDSVSDEQQEISTVTLANGTELVTTLCWMAAYNYGLAVWLIEPAHPDKAIFQNVEATDFRDGVLQNDFKARGLGDCWSRDSWVFDGKGFQRSGSFSTGECRGIPGGVDPMPDWVTQVVEAKEKS
ncbi:hypothetical protein NFHSH190041_30780 [Shewanella sp. NFH-SH190041]|uniref:DUF1176 domain-containing protein n=1 Tax=Shewanella sp. NFH-SH190041 TaxID=2950245 RepID=UPI0021C271B0|nr:DUF1176 domain-containing protein [Shewanella sp. NFH-SH190041]BDM65626.1 hypothetical protein NFHSH190041_30780 [Shewanella sp. NFH-SH190041]